MISLSQDTPAFIPALNAHEVPVMERVEAPLIWERLKCNVRVQDLHEPYYNAAMELIHDLVLNQEPLCRSLGISHDEEAREEYLSSIKLWMKDNVSLIAVDEGTGKVVGVMLGRVMEEDANSHTFLRVRDSAVSSVHNADSRYEVPKSISQVVSKHSRVPSTKASFKISKQEPTLSSVLSSCSSTSGNQKNPRFTLETFIYKSKKVQLMQSLLAKVLKDFNMFKIYGVKSYFRMYGLAIRAEYRTKGVAKALIKSTKEQACMMEMEWVVGVFTSGAEQNLAKSLGFKLNYEIFYSDWIIEGDVVFEDPGPGNYSVGMWACSSGYLEKLAKQLAPVVVETVTGPPRRSKAPPKKAKEIMK